MSHIDTNRFYGVYILINAIILFLQAKDNSSVATIETIWINTSIIYLASVIVNFRELHNCGVMENLLISQRRFTIFLLKQLVAYWLKIGIGMILIADIILLLCAKFTFYNFIGFNLSLLYCTLFLTVIGNIGNSLTLHSSDSTLVIIISIPFILPIFISAKMIGDYGFDSGIISLSIINSVNIIIAPFLLEWMIRLNAEDG